MSANQDAIAMGSPQRAFYLQARELQKNYGLQDVNLSMSKLRYDNIFPASVINSFDWSPNQNENLANATTSPVNRLLNNGDVFFMYRMGLFVQKLTTITGTVYYGKSQLRTYPNPLFFTGANESTSLYELYNGVWSLKINVKEVIPGASMEKFLGIDMAQQGSNTVPYGSDTFNWDRDMKEIQPNPILIGSLKSRFQVNLPEPAQLSLTATNVNACTWLAEGILFSGVSDKIISQITNDMYGISN